MLESIAVYQQTFHTQNAQCEDKMSAHPTFFRVLLFQPCELATSFEKHLLKAEDVLCIYHKGVRISLVVLGVKVCFRV